MENLSETYKVGVYCCNCKLRYDKEIIKGLVIYDTTCDYCGCQKLRIDKYWKLEQFINK